MTTRVEQVTDESAGSRSFPAGRARGAGHAGWAFMYLLRLLVLRDFQTSYRRTLLGVGWALAKPLLTVSVFVLVFEVLMRVPPTGGPYFLFALTGLLPWQLFADSLSRGGMSLVANRSILERSNVRRMVFPLASVLNATLTALPSFLILAVLLAANGTPGTAALWGLPLLFGLQVAMSVGLALPLSVLTAYVRDLAVALPFLLQILMLASPVAYPVDLVPEAYRELYLLNPLALLVGAYRDVLLHGTWPAPLVWAKLTGTAAGLLIVGALVFGRLNRRLPDVL